MAANGLAQLLDREPHNHGLEPERYTDSQRCGIGNDVVVAEAVFGGCSTCRYITLALAAEATGAVIITNARAGYVISLLQRRGVKVTNN